MKGPDPVELQSGDLPADKSGDGRKTRGISCSDPEWKEVKEAAEPANMPVAEFVREKLLEIARGRDGAGSSSPSTDLARPDRALFSLGLDARYPVGSRVHGDYREGLLEGVWKLSDTNGAAVERECRRKGR